MKKIVLFVLFAVLLVACAPVAQGFVDLPVEQEAGILIVVTALLALAFDFAIGVVPWLVFLRQYQEGFAVAFSGLAISTIENALPDGSEAVALPGVNFFIAVALYLLVRTVATRKQVKGFVKQ